MWSLEQPGASAPDAFDASRTLIRNLQNRPARLADARDAIIDLMAEYKTRGLASELHCIAPNEVTAGTIERSEMVLLYTSGLLREGAGRHIYDAIMALAPNKRCPYCGHRHVEELDHFLPKSKYPAFSVTPLNLVPSCGKCNKDKLAGDADTLADMPLHPYFEEVDQVRWLKAQVKQESTAAVFLFEVDDNCGLSASDLARLKVQFENLNLGDLYTTVANQKLSLMRGNLRKQFSINGDASVKVFLWDEFLSARDYLQNAWETAFCEAAHQSDWFCKGGFDDPDLP